MQMRTVRLHHTKTVSDLQPATTGSAGMDLATAADLLIKEQRIYIVGTAIFRPLPDGMLGLIIGQSSATTQGIIVYPGVIDSDYQGEIKIICCGDSTEPRRISKCYNISLYG
uniref:dUTPase-like domain-containing protein n=1 Tax=Aquila chrysaetos chrysaetos TaxID=223781 RepID=A0A663FJJ5_AQUCH